jgi:hypothetical protein
MFIFFVVGLTSCSHNELIEVEALKRAIHKFEKRHRMEKRFYAEVSIILQRQIDQSDSAKDLARFEVFAQELDNTRESSLSKVSMISNVKQTLNKIKGNNLSKVLTIVVDRLHLSYSLDDTAEWFEFCHNNMRDVFAQVERLSKQTIISEKAVFSDVLSDYKSLRNSNVIEIVCDYSDWSVTWLWFCLAFLFSVLAFRLEANKGVIIISTAD